MNPHRQRRRFLLLGDRRVGRADNAVYCRVELIRGADRFAGEAGDIDSDSGRTRASINATLHAAEKAVGPGCRLALEGLAIRPLFGRDHIIVSIEAAIGRRFARLPGIAVVEPSLEDAACAAALDAVERWLAR